MADAPHHEILAVRYARAVRTPGDAFLSRDPHDAPGEMDYFVWVVRGGGPTLVVDTGFGAEAAARRGRTLLRPVDAALADVGVDCAAVDDVVITHLHYDHAGNLPLFPRATFHVQDREVAYATGRFMCHPVLSYPFDAEDVCCLIRRVYAGRVRFHDGDAELLPGVSLHLIGGHSHGLMALRVATARGHVVLASDAAHYYANLERPDPFPILLHLGEVLEGYRRLVALADSADHIVPGHDPLVRARYPAVAGADAVALHMPPRRATMS